MVNFLKFASIKRALHYTGLYSTSSFDHWRNVGFLPIELEGVVEDMKRSNIKKLMEFERNGILYLSKQKQTFEIIHATIHKRRMPS